MEGDLLDARRHDRDEAGSPRRILIVEDDEHLASILERWVLDHYGDAAEVHVATTIEEGRAELSELATLDVALLDRHFPRGAGDDLIEPIRARFDPIIVMITGVEPKTELIRLPVHDYLVKPIERPELVKRLALLEKLETSGALDAFADARKASLLEFHLEDPEGDPLFRRFAARWSYDRLEVAAGPNGTYVYELYIDDADDVSHPIRVSVIGTLDEDLEDLVGDEELEPVGELVPSGRELAWIDVDRREVVDPPPNGYVIYSFASDVPEAFVTANEVANGHEIERDLERAYG